MERNRARMALVVLGGAVLGIAAFLEVQPRPGRGSEG
jgi:hypothetical protein